MADLLGEDFSFVAQKDNLYRCLDKLLEHRGMSFSGICAGAGRIFSG